MPNISRGKGSQEMKFNQLIEFNMKHFFKKSYTKFGEETRPIPFSEKLKLTYLWISNLKFYIVCLFILYVKLRISKYIEPKLQATYFYFILSFFKK